MIDNKQAKSENSPMSATNFVMYQKMKQSGSRSSERTTMKEEDSYHYALAREYFHLGNEHQKSKEYRLSINFFQTALKYKYDSPEIHNNIGVVYVLNKNYQKAQESFNKSIQNKLSQIFPKINLANLKFKQDKFTAGIQIFLQLLSVNKDKRIINHFNKVLASHNNFYRFFKSNFIASHPNVDNHTLEETTKYIVEDINKNKPIIVESIESLSASVLSASQIQEIQSLFTIIRLKYSSLKWMKSRSELSQTCAHGDELAKCIQGLKSQKASNIIKLLFMYAFMEEQKTDLSLYFYSLIDKFEDKEIRKQYAQLYTNYTKVKNQQNMPFHRHYSVTIDNQNCEQRRQIVQSIERFFFIEKLPVFRLHQMRNWKHLPNSQRAVQILGKTFQGLQNYQQISAFAFDQYQKYGSTVDYKLQAAMLQYLVPKSKDLQLGRDKILNKTQNLLKDGDYFSEDENFKTFECMLVILVLKKEFQRAIQICHAKLAEFPEREDKIEQYIGSIYFQTHHFQKAAEHLKISHQLNPNNQETDYKLACIYFQRLSLRRSVAKRQYMVTHYQECFSPQYARIMSKQYQLSLQHILHAISIDPTKIKYYYLLEMIYQYSYYKDEAITLHLSKLLEENYRPKDFKVRANIAIFYAMVYQYDKSYHYFKEVLQKGLSEVDTNCQDVELLCFIRKCGDTAHLLTLDYSEFGWVTELAFYFIIFNHTPELFQKYDQNSHQVDPRYFQYINCHLGRAIQLPDQLIERLEHFDDNHKQIIYRYIFRSDYLKKKAIDLVKLYEKAIQIQQLRHYLFSIEVQIKMKQYKMVELKEIFDYILSFEHSVPKNQYFSKSYLILLSEIIKDKQKLFAKLDNNSFETKFHTKFTYYIVQRKPHLSFKIECSHENHYRFTNRKLQSIVYQSIQIINSQYRKYVTLHNDTKKFRFNTLYQGLVLLSIEEVLPSIIENGYQQQMLASNCRQLLINRNIDKFHTKITNHLYEKEETYDDQSVFNPSLGSVLGQSRLSNLSEKSIQPKSESQQPPQNEYSCKSYYESMMQTHLQQENIFQLLCQINSQNKLMAKGASQRLSLYKLTVAFIKNCEELDILVTHSNKKCHKLDNGKFTIQCSQLIKIGPTNNIFTSDKRLFQYTCDMLKEIMSLSEKGKKPSTDKTPFTILLQDQYFWEDSQNELKNEDLAHFLKIIQSKMRKYHLKMLQDMHKGLFDKQYYYSKKLLFYVRLLTRQKINYQKFLRLVQERLGDR